MKDAQFAALGKHAAALIDDMDQEDQVIFGRDCHFTKEQRDRMIADELRKLVALHRRMARETCTCGAVEFGALALHFIPCPFSDEPV